MSSVTNEATCKGCGGTFTYDFNLKTGKYTKVTMCECDKETVRLKKEVRQLKKEIKELKKKMQYL